MFHVKLENILAINTGFEALRSLCLLCSLKKNCDMKEYQDKFNVTNKHSFTLMLFYIPCVNSVLYSILPDICIFITHKFPSLSLHLKLT